MHILKSKMEPATNRIKRLLEVLSSYSFNLYYIKGKDMILSDFLSRQIEDDSNPHEIIPISFNIREILQENYYNLVSDTYKVQTRAQAKAQTDAPIVSSTQPVAWRDAPKIVKLPIKTGKEKESKTLPSGIVQQPPKGIVIPLGALIPPTVMPPSIRLPPKPSNVDNATSLNLGPEPNMDIEENSPHQEGIIIETYVVPDQSYLDKPQELIKPVNTSKVVQQYLPQQADIDKILNIIKRKVLKGIHLPLTIKEIQAGYLQVKYLYRYLAQNVMPRKRHTRCKVEALAESFILLDSLLF